MGAMKEKRTIQTVQKSIAAFFRENRRMLSDLLYPSSDLHPSEINTG